MYLGFNRPKGGTFTVSGTGAAITSPTAQLNDGRPDTPTSFTWNTGTQNTSTVFRLRYEWAGAIVPGLVGLSGLSLPAGTKIQCAFRRSSDTEGTYPYTPTMLASMQRAFAGIHGGRTAWLLVAAGASPVVGCEIQIYNDVNGVASIAAAAPFTIGEAVIAQGMQVLTEPKWSLQWSQPPQPNMGGSEQGFSGYVPPPWRTFTCKLPVDDQGQYIGNTTAGKYDYEQIVAAVDRMQSCVFIPRYLDQNGAYDAQAAHRTAILGVATTVPGFQQVSGPYFTGNNTLVAREYPVPAPAV